jgi:hypothetical protein
MAIGRALFFTSNDFENIYIYSSPFYHGFKSLLWGFHLLHACMTDHDED